MPELPEVETIRTGLEKYLVGHKILDIEVKEAKIFQGDKKNVIGARIQNIQRIGKGLIINLDNNYSMAIHLKLTGQIIYRGEKVPKVSKVSKKAGGELPSKFTHVIFKLDQGAFLYYNDVRKFGWIKVVKKDKIQELPFFKEMGPEPFVGQASSGQANWLTLESFKSILSLSSRPVKIILLDQKRIGGIGNIYANEALFLARIDPKRKSKDLSDKEINKLYGSILEVLKRGLKYGGSSDVDFVNALGQEGEYQDHFLVYGRQGKDCSNCRGKIKRIVVGGRGTFFCPNCQK